jgi:uncharacterized cupredoxin-like copper-binding protein
VRVSKQDKKSRKGRLEIMLNTRNATCAFGVLTAITALATVGIACGGGSSAANTPTAAKVAATATKPPDPTPGPAGTDTEKEQNVAISLAEWKITGQAGAAIGPLKAGEVQFDVHNNGTTQHEFVLIRTDADPTALPVVDGKVNEDTAGESPGEADDIEAGQAKTATIRLSPGKYVFLCNVLGHYLSGMRGQLIVQ